MIGVVGLEVYDIIGLLRSLAVMPEARKMGVGKDLCLREIAHAYTQNIDELYLLTTTAEGFFTKLGFEKIARRLSPAPLQTSIEFQKLCPDSAV
jgi:amino-acid N-acetyltransferase